MATAKRERRVSSRADVPRYAKQAAISLSGEQLRQIFKRGYRTHPIAASSSGVVRITQLHDGSWWVEKRGEAVFWARRWYQLPTVVGERARRIRDFVAAL